MKVHAVAHMEVREQFEELVLSIIWVPGIKPVLSRLFFFFKLHLFVYMCVGTCALAYMWSSEDNLKEWVLSFYHKDPRNPTQVVMVAASTFTY